MAQFTIVLAAVAICTMLSSCGSSSSTLQSLTIHEQVATDFPQFKATGTLSNGKQVGSLAVSWLSFVPVIDFVAHPS
jgi:uncharacterized lipoprotein